MSILRSSRIVLSLAVLMVLPLTAATVQAQQSTVQTVENLAHWSPEGTYVFVSNAGLSEDAPQQERVAAIVYRRQGGQGAFEKIAEVQQAPSLEAFRERTTVEVMQAIERLAEKEAGGDVWTFIQEHRRLEDYGFFGFNKELWPALGTAYLDPSSADAPDGTTFTYEVRYRMVDGSISDEGVRGTATVGTRPDIQRPRLLRRVERDTLVGVQWAAPVRAESDAFFARVYRQSEGGGFERLPSIIFANRSDSLIRYNYAETVPPESFHRYYIEPVDIVGNPGPPSDTVGVVSVDFNNIPLVGEVEAHDTTGGIHLSWKPLPPKAYLTGVEIQRSGDPRSGYVTLDTVSLRRTEYLDTRLLPNKTYYYRFRVATLRDINTLPSAVASASHENRLHAPPPPSKLTAEHQGRDVRLTWEPSASSDLFGYYVYRGTSRHDSLVVASRALDDSVTTFVDTSAVLDGRTNYVYAVQAVNMSNLQSELSNMVTIRPARPVLPAAPLGLNGYADQGRIRLSWNDAAGRDDAVTGYRAYRSTTPPDVPGAELQGAEAAEAAGMQRVGGGSATTAFDDADVQEGQTYYYAVSSVDAFGVESTLSPVASVTYAASPLRPPSQVQARAVSAGIEVAWNAMLEQDVSGYRVFRRTRNAAQDEPVATVGADETAYVDVDVEAGTLYIYTVRTLRRNQQSPPSREKGVMR